MFEIEDEVKTYVVNSFSNEEISTITSTKYYISGGTGFIGKWLVCILDLVCSGREQPDIKIISRSATNGARLFQFHDNVSVTTWESLKSEVFSESLMGRVAGFHASVPAASAEKIRNLDLDTLNSATSVYTNYLGRKYQHPIFVNISSGAVYKRPEDGLILEVGAEAKISDLSNYDKVKIDDEWIVKTLTEKGFINGASPRLFSFTGPGLELPGNFAIANFMYDAISKRPVEITGNQLSSRSYMSPIDMGIWLLKTSLYPTLENLHIGSNQGNQMIEIAHLISHRFGIGEVEINSTIKSIPESYVPETTRTSSLLNVHNIIPFDEAINLWHKSIS
jgi:dTDP-glucose 4,6-dehydratase